MFPTISSLFRKDFTKAPDPDEPEKLDEEAVGNLMAACYSMGEDDTVITLDPCELIGLLCKLCFQLYPLYLIFFIRMF